MSSPTSGAGPERTGLAWQRTALAVLLASAVVGRLAVDRVGPIALTSVVVAGPLALWLAVVATSRGRDPAAAGGPVQLGALRPAALALSVAVLALVELTAVLAAIG